MTNIELAGDAVNVEAEAIAADLGLSPEGVLDALRDKRLTAVCEQGLEQDAGRWRLTFYHATRRLRLVIDHTGRVLERSAVRQRPRNSKLARSGQPTRR